EGQAAEAEEEGGGAGAASAGTTQVESSSGFALPITLDGTTMSLDFGDVREDRVVLYGAAEPDVRELKYSMKATNVGTYVVAPVQATALYDSSVFARGAGGKISVVGR